MLWTLDFQFDVTADGRTLKMLNVIDEFTRERPAIEVARRLDTDHVVNVMHRLVIGHGAPGYLRFDKRGEFIARAVADWSRFDGVDTIFIDPGSPWQNAWIGSFNTGSVTCERRIWVTHFAQPASAGLRHMTGASEHGRPELSRVTNGPI